MQKIKIKKQSYCRQYLNKRYVGKNNLIADNMEIKSVLKFAKIRDEQQNLEVRWRGLGSVLESKKIKVGAAVTVMSFLHHKKRTKKKGKRENVFLEIFPMQTKKIKKLRGKKN